MPSPQPPAHDTHSSHSSFENVLVRANCVPSALHDGKESLLPNFVPFWAEYIGSVSRPAGFAQMFSKAMPF